MENVFAIDPSGNFSDREGFGTTGWAYFYNGVLKEVGATKAQDYNNQESYWFNVAEDMMLVVPDVVVCESFRLFAHKAMQQSGSSMDTPQLIGYLRMVLYERGVPIVFQGPSCKARFSDDVMAQMGVINKKGKSYYFEGNLLSMHERDAIRHGLYYLKYGRN